MNARLVVLTVVVVILLSCGWTVTPCSLENDYTNVTKEPVASSLIAEDEDSQLLRNAATCAPKYKT